MSVSPLLPVGPSTVSPSAFERIKIAGSWAVRNTLLKIQELVTFVWVQTSSFMASRSGPIALFSTLTAAGIYIFYTRHANVSPLRRKVLGIFVLMTAFAAGVASGRAMYLIRV